MAKYLDSNGLLYFWQKVKQALAAKENSFTKNTAFNKNFETTATNIKMNGTQAVGSLTTVARADHVHPIDTSRLATSGNASNVTAAFTAATTRTNLVTGEKLSVSLGKMMKWYTDLKPVAWSGAYADLTGLPNFIDANDVHDIIDSYGYKSESQIRTIITGYGYQNASNVNLIINGKGFQTASQVQTAIDTAVSSVYKLKGSVATVSDLPTTGNKVGDVWNVTTTGMNYVWTGTAWDALGSEFQVEAITNAEIDTIIAS